MELVPRWALAYLIFIPVLVVWSAAWKGVALWLAGRNRQLAWYIVMFIINTAGVLEIIYIFAFSRRRKAPC